MNNSHWVEVGCDENETYDDVNIVDNLNFVINSMSCFHSPGTHTRTHRHTHARAVKRRQQEGVGAIAVAHLLSQYMAILLVIMNVQLGVGGVEWSK